MKNLRNVVPENLVHKGIINKGVKSLISTIKDARNHPKTLLFLLSYMLYNDGVQSVIVLAAVFGSAELGLSMDTLIICILIVQFVAFFGALFFNFIAKKFGDFVTLKALILIWIAVIIYAFGFLHTTDEFYIMCISVGMIMGATQAISRSIYSQIIPSGKETEYFSIYELSEKGTS